jgi:ssDNA-binding replication factor A large subunit
VGLIEDDTGRTKFTSWTKSDPKLVQEGDHVRLREVEKSWYEGRVSVAVTGWSQIEFPDRGRWWDE